MSETLELCDVAIGPNCGLCKCRREAGHSGQHENYHGSRFGIANLPVRHVAAHNSGLVEELRVLWALTVEVRSYASGLEGLAHAHGADLSAGKALGERIDAWYEANRAALTALEQP